MSWIMTTEAVVMRGPLLQGRTQSGAAAAEKQTPLPEESQRAATSLEGHLVASGDTEQDGSAFTLSPNDPLLETSHRDSWQKRKRRPPPTRSLQDCLSLSKAADNQSSGINKTAVQLWGAGGQYGQPGQGRQEVLWGKNMKNWVFILEDGEQEFPYICLYQTLWKEQQLFNGERISVWRWERSGDGWWRWLPCEWM